MNRLKRVTFIASFLLCSFSTALILITPIFEADFSHIDFSFSQNADDFESNPFANHQGEKKSKESEEKKGKKAKEKVEKEMELYTSLFQSNNSISSIIKHQSLCNLQQFTKDGFLSELYKPPAIS